MIQAFIKPRDSPREAATIRKMSNSSSLLVNGDLVQRKSGGPEMTVHWIGNDYASISAECQWNDEDGQIQTRLFPLKELGIVTKPSLSAKGAAPYQPRLERSEGLGLPGRNPQG